MGVAALLASVAAPPAASAEVLFSGAGEPVSIGAATTPYPSELFVSGADGDIVDVNVNVTLSHTWPDDVDIALVSPSGDAEVLMSDACGSGNLASAQLTFNDEAAVPLTDNGPCSSGTFKPTNIGIGDDNWSGEGPGVVESASLASFDGEFPNGTWELFVLDDVPGEDDGSISSWSLTITTATAEVIVPGTGTVGKAKPFPSTKTFNTPAGQVISDLNFRTPSFNHTWPEDVDMLLVGPRRGANAMLMSDACGSQDIRGFLWTFDDEASSAMGSSFASCLPFVLRPVNIGGSDPLPAPAPAAPFGSALSVFDGLEGGAFSLFASDDVGGDSGYLNSWTILMTTRNAADTGFTVASTRVEEGGKAVLTVNRTPPAGVSVGSLGPATINVSTGGDATAGSDYTAPAGSIEFGRGQASATIEVPIADDKVDEATERLNVVLSSPRDDARLAGAASAEVVIGPDNVIKFGKLKRNAKKGTARLFVNVPGPGVLTLSGKQVKRVKKAAKKAGKVALPIKAKGKALGRLKKKGKAKVRAKVAFTPNEGTAFEKTKKVKLVRKG